MAYCITLNLSNYVRAFMVEKYESFFDDDEKEEAEQFLNSITDLADFMDVTETYLFEGENIGKQDFAIAILHSIDWKKIHPQVLADIENIKNEK